MSEFFIPLPYQELLHHILQVGGMTACPLQRPEQTIHASFEVELTDNTAVVSVDFGGHSGRLTLRRSDRANHLHLRDFIQDIANGRIESAVACAPNPELAPIATQINRMLDESEALINGLRKLLVA